MGTVETGAAVPAIPALTVTTAGQRIGQVWALSSHAPATLLPLPLGAVASARWRSLLSEMPGILPVLTDHPARLVRHPPMSLLLGHECRVERGEAHVLVEPVAIDGESLGGALAILQCGELLGIVPSSDLAASVALAGETALPVEGLPEKIAALWDLAPGIARLAVCVEQETEARDIAASLGEDSASRLAVIGIRTLSELLHLAYPDLIPRAISALLSRTQTAIESGDNLASLADGVLDAMEGIVLDPNRGLSDWQPVASAFDRIEAMLHDAMSEDARRRVALYRAIVGRHRGLEMAVPLPTLEWLQTQPVPDRLGIAAQMLQQTHDTDSLSIADALDLGDALLRDEPASVHYLPHWRLRGAMARVRRYAACLLAHAPAREQEALETVLAEQESILAGLQRAIRRRQAAPIELSFQLSECFLLASFLSPPAGLSAFERAETRWRAIAAHITLDQGAYVSLARARCAVVHGIRAPGVAEDLAALANASGLASHVQCSARRWLARWHDDRGQTQEAESHRGALRARCHPASGFLRAFVLLADLDLAARTSGALDAPAAATHLAAITALRNSAQLVGFGRVLAATQAPLTVFRERFPY